jgi:hypothetical protein
MEVTMPIPRKYKTDAQRQAAYRKRTAAAAVALANAKGLPTPAVIPSMPSSARWKAMAANASSLLQSVCQEMTAYADDRSEAWQESERTETIAEQIAAVESAIDGLDQAGL